MHFCRRKVQNRAHHGVVGVSQHEFRSRSCAEAVSSNTSEMKNSPHFLARFMSKSVLLNFYCLVVSEHHI
jgi:hypothetical protein